MAHFRAIIKPLDTYLIREGRPFEQTDEGLSEADSLFPPPQTVLAAVVRVALARAAGWNGNGSWMDKHSILGDGPYAENGDIRLGAAHLIRKRGTESDALWPAPAHLMLPPAETVAREPLLAKPGQARRNDLTAHGIRPITLEGSAGRQYAPTDNYWITRNGLNAILGGSPPAVASLIPASSLQMTEDKIGIERDNSRRVAKEARLYRVGHRRLETRDFEFHARRQEFGRRHDLGEVCFVLEITVPPALKKAADSLKRPTIVPFGGQGRAAEITLSEVQKEIPSVPENGLSGKGGAIRYSVTLLSSAVVSNTLSPFEGGQLPGSFPGTLAGIAGGRPLLLSAWNHGTSWRTALTTALPAGTTWFYEVQNMSIRDLYSKLQNIQKVGLGDQAMARIGHGSFAIGSWTAAANHQEIQGKKP